MPVLVCEKCEQRSHEEKERYQKTPQPCSICGSAHAPKAMLAVSLPGRLRKTTEVGIWDPTASWDEIKVCPVNPELALDPVKVTCIACDARYLPFQSKKLCPTCQTGPALEEWQRVQNNNALAEAKGAPATLTIKQWMRAIDHFGGKCAYC